MNINIIIIKNLPIDDQQPPPETSGSMKKIPFSQVFLNKKVYILTVLPV